MKTRLYLGLALLTLPCLAQAADRPGSKPPASEQDKIVCRTSAQTGSFANVTRTCLTKREWQQRFNDSRAVGESMQQRMPTDHEQPVSAHGVSGPGA